MGVLAGERLRLRVFRLKLPPGRWVVLGAPLVLSVILSPAKALTRSELPAPLPGPTGAAKCPNPKWAELVLLPNFGRCCLTLVPAWVTALGTCVAAAKEEAVAVPEGPTARLAGKAGQVWACVPKVDVVCDGPPRVPWVVLPKAGWPGAEVVAWAGAGAACLPPWTEVAEVLAPCCCPLGARTAVCAVAPGFSGSFEVEVWLRRLSAGRLLAPAPKAVLALEGV